MTSPPRGDSLTGRGSWWGKDPNLEFVLRIDLSLSLSPPLLHHLDRASRASAPKKDPGKRETWAWSGEDSEQQWRKVQKTQDS